MSNFFCEDAYMDSTSYYDGEPSWDERCYKKPQYDMPYHYEEPLAMPQYDMPYHYEDGEHSWNEQCYETPQYDVPYHYEEPQVTNSIKYMLQRIMEDQERMSTQHHEDNKRMLAQLDDIEESHRRIQTFISSSMNEEEEGCTEENIEMEVATHQHVQTFEAHAPPSIPLENINLDLETRKTFEHLTDDDAIEDFPARLVQAYYDHDDTSSTKEEQVLGDSPKDEDFFSDDSCMKQMIDEEHDDSSHISPSDHNVLLDGQIEFEDVEPPKDQGHDDFVEIFMDPFQEQPCIEVNTNSNEYFRDWAPKHIIGKLEESVPIKLDVCVEDPFFIILRQDKFRSFQPYISRSFERSSHNPSILKGAICKKGLSMQRKLHCRLDGREFQWNFKVD